jgi:hypothetical protein
MTDISDPHFAERVRESFDRQNVMHLIRATLPVIEHSRTEIHLPHWEAIEQQHAFVHGGIVGTIADSAARYAAMTVVPHRDRRARHPGAVLARWGLAHRSITSAASRKPESLRPEHENNCGLN